MYFTVLVSILAISTAGLVALFVFRAWELKHGRVHAKGEEREPIAPRIYEARHTVKKAVYILVWYVYKRVRAVGRILVRTNYLGLGKIQQLISGKRHVDSSTGSSLYLKDIGVHKQKMANSSGHVYEDAESKKEQHEKK